MAQRRFVAFLAAVLFLIGLLDASPRDANPVYRVCVEQCEWTGRVGDNCFQQCNFSSDGIPSDGLWYLQGLLYRQCKQWDCQSDCRYHCMVTREEERQKLGHQPEPASIALSALNLALQFHGWVSFYILVNYKLPFRLNKRTYYEYTGLWNIYAVFAMDAWIWSAVFHSWDVDLTEKLDYLSAVALLAYSLILSLSLLWALYERLEAARVMVAASLLAFVATHILYLNFYQLDYGLNMKVRVTMGLIQIAVWAVWAGINFHPAHLKLCAVLFGGMLAMLLEVYDFPPYAGLVDAHALGTPPQSLLRTCGGVSLEMTANLEPQFLSRRPSWVST